MSFRDRWFENQNWWFGCTPETDNLIIQTFSHLLDDFSDDPLTNILVFDQLSRHVFRNGSNKHVIEYFLKKALIVLKHTDQTYIDNLNSQEWCFMYLPMRHTNDFNNISIVMDLCWKKLLKNKDDLVIKRFLKATYERCPVNYQNMDFYDIYELNDLHRMFDANIFKAYSTILEHKYKYENEKIIDLPRIKTEEKNLLLSISGGVDSMLCSFLLKDQCKYAIHINYQNRSTSNLEEEFVKRWCRDIKIPLYVRRIKEIQRKPCMENGLREIYESYTRLVRYGCYKTIGGTVILGHNKDDCLENIFTNIANSNNYQNLKGMDTFSTQDNIIFYRPLLNISKEDIRKFAYQNYIPYLPTSTPIWSMRGQIRNDIVPVLDKWNPHYVINTYKLSDTLQSFHKFLDSYINKLVKTYNETNMLILDDLPEDVLFWRELIKKITNHIISNKSLTAFLERKRRDNMTIILNKELKMTILKNEVFFTWDKQKKFLKQD